LACNGQGTVSWAHFCLRGNLVDQLTGAQLQIIGYRQHRERGNGLRNAARIAHDRGELFEKCAKAVGRRTVFKLL
jgi:hypothetical protein